MKTKITNSDSRLKNRIAQRKKQLPRIDFTRRWQNRGLSTEALLNVLRSETPGFFELAEVVGKWVWIQFTDKQPPTITRALAELGFHWNKTRQSWQHPCGTVAFERATYDPRRRYGSFFAADIMPN
jgi:hypothetical protein